MSSRFPRLSLTRLIGAVLFVILVIAMILNTKFLTPAEVAAALPKPFNAKTTAADLFTKAQSELPGKAQPVEQVIPAIQKSPKDAAAQFKAVSPGENAYVFAVKATGKVTDASANNLRLAVPGAPGETPLLVPLSTAINGSTLRDIMGFKFADAPGQTEYQFVGDELKKLVQSKVVASISDPASLKGKTVTIIGAISVLDMGGPPPKAKPVNIQPISIKEGS